MSGFSTARAMLAALPLTALLVAALAAPALAQYVPVGFRSPSNNIHCQFDDGSDNSEASASIRCDIRQIANRPPPRPRDCDLDWGRGFEIAGKADVGARICYGDTVMDDRLPVLLYGQSFQRRGLTCKSEPGGVTCINAKGHGFQLSRNAQRVF